MSAASRQGKELILATKAYASDHTPTSWWHVLSTTSLFLLSLSAQLTDLPLALKIFLSVLAGLLFLRLFVLYHDQQHHAILPKSKIAPIFMRIFGILVLSPSRIWSSSHNHHHKHNSRIPGTHIGSFPVMTKEHYLKSPIGVRLTYLFMRHPLTILFGYVFVFLYGMCLKPFLAKPAEHRDCLFALILHVCIAVLLVDSFGWTTWLLIQTGPHFVACGLGTYLFYAQHNFPEVSFYDKAGWTYEKAALESSSYMKMSPVMAWFTGNIGYHHIHHLNARIPFYRLPEVQNAMFELQRPKTTSLNPFEIWQCLGLKVWDTEAQKMVGLREKFFFPFRIRTASQ